MRCRTLRCCRWFHPIVRSGGRSFGEWAILGEMCDRAIGRSGDREMGDRDLRTPNKETGFLPKSMGCNEEIPAVGNRVYTNDVRMVRGRRGYSEIENHRVKSSTREGGFCLCSRGFNRRGFWVSTAGGFGFQPLGVLWMGDRLRLRYDFLANGRSGFLWMGDLI